MKATKTLFTLRQAARYLGIDEASLMQWVVLGKMAGAALNGSMRFCREHLDLFVKELAEQHYAAMQLPLQDCPIAAEIASRPRNPLVTTTAPRQVRRSRRQARSRRRNRAASSRRCRTVRMDD